MTHYPDTSRGMKSWYKTRYNAQGRYVLRNRCVFLSICTQL